MQHIWYGAVVPFQTDEGTVLEVRLETPDVPDVRSAEAVDGLVVVAYHEQVLTISENVLDQPVLGRVDVLVFIYQDFGPQGLKVFSCLFAGFKQPDGEVNQVFENHVSRQNNVFLQG